jgi:serine/threonine protein phosphatase 1
MKTLVIGDIHGCYREMMELLNKAALTDTDQIIALGDILDRGPDSPSVLNFFRTRPNALSLMGNHERKHLFISRGEGEAAPSQILTREQFGAGYRDVLEFITGFPDFMELPEAILIHGQFEPGVPLIKQQPQVLNGTMTGESYLRRRYEKPWYELYDGIKPVIAGHHDYSKAGKPVIFADKAFLIDTGCCYGHCLTGVLLPEFRLVCAKSGRNYWGLARQNRSLDRN